MYAIKKIAIKPEKNFEALDGIWFMVTWFMAEHFKWFREIHTKHVLFFLSVADGYEPTIQAAIQQFTELTCIKWQPREDEARWITFVKKPGWE